MMNILPSLSKLHFTTILVLLVLLVGTPLPANLPTAAPRTAPSTTAAPGRSVPGIAPAATPHLNAGPLAEPWLINWATKQFGGTTPAPPNDICSTQNTVFAAGEQITYLLYYNWNFVWLAAGEVDFKVHELPNQFHITVEGSTYDSYEWLYSSTQRFESYLDKETLLPEIHIKDVSEGSGYSRYDRTVFNQEKHTATSFRGETRKDLKPKQIDFEGCMHDLVSIVYYARNLRYADMRVGEEIPIEILMDQEIYPLQIKYLGPEQETRIKGLGYFNTQRFSPQLIAGDVFKEGDEMKIWVSDDGNKLPLLIESPVSVGSVKAVLKSYSGLKYPLSSEVK